MTEPRSDRVNFHLFPTTEGPIECLLHVWLHQAAFLAIAWLGLVLVASSFKHDV